MLIFFFFIFKINQTSIRIIRKSFLFDRFNYNPNVSNDKFLWIKFSSDSISNVEILNESAHAIFLIRIITIDGSSMMKSRVSINFSNKRERTPFSLPSRRFVSLFSFSCSLHGFIASCDVCLYRWYVYISFK